MHKLLRSLNYYQMKYCLNCFEYLDGVHIFYSFDQLNYRFDNLIRNIPLYVDFQHVQTSKFHLICTKMFSDQETKKQIHSLHLTNKDTCYPIQLYLSIVSFDEFIHLRSLTLTDVHENNILELRSMLTLIPQLTCFRLIDSKDEKNEILSALSISQLRTLMLSKLPSGFNHKFKLSSIINLTISICSTDQFCQILNNVFNLKYLKVQNFTAGYNRLTNKDICGINLKQLIIMKYEGNFHDLVIILKQMPNLKHLTIFSFSYRTDFIDAYGWEDLITSSLPLLNIFKFNFKYRRHPFDHEKIIQEKFKKFQSDFWQKQHQWYTEYFISNDLAMIYSIPYIFDTYELTSCTGRYRNELMNNIDTFVNVVNLSMNPEVLTEKCQYYFSHVTSLKFGDLSIYSSNCWALKHIEYLKMVVNCSNIKHLTISKSYSLQETSVLLELMKKAPQLSSIAINPCLLLQLFNDDELCKYLNKTIEKLEIYLEGEDLFSNSNRRNQFCKAFTNIQQLICKIDQPDSLLFLLKSLPKLSYIKVCKTSYWFLFHLFNFGHEIQKMGIRIITQMNVENSNKDLSIWILETYVKCIQLPIDN